jgi:hypothetical protein
VRHLQFSSCGYYAHTGKPRHAQKVMGDLGITYQLATPQSVADQWWFWNCQNVPDELPPYLTDLSFTPHEMVGYGLSQEEADEIVEASVL